MTFEFALRLFTAFACGVAIGLERQMRQRTAGLRTITLVASGACLFVTLGVLTGNGIPGVTQIAAYVVSGVGFLGGGVIMRDKGSIQGINTAATLWCSAAVGVLAGAGHYMPAFAGTGVVLLTNTLLRGVSQAINATPVSNADLVREYQITVICLAVEFDVCETVVVPEPDERRRPRPAGPAEGDRDAQAASEGPAEARTDREPHQHGEKRLQRQLDREGSRTDDGMNGARHAGAAARPRAVRRVQGVSISPVEIALTTACTLLVAPSFSRTLLTWKFTVRSEMLRI